MEKYYTDVFSTLFFSISFHRDGRLFIPTPLNLLLLLLVLLGHFTDGMIFLHHSPQKAAQLCISVPNDLVYYLPQRANTWSKQVDGLISGTLQRAFKSATCSAWQCVDRFCVTHFSEIFYGIELCHGMFIHVYLHNYTPIAKFTSVDVSTGHDGPKNGYLR